MGAMADVTAPPAPTGKWSRRFRSLAAVILVIVFAFSFLASGVGIWLKRNTLNNDVWAERVVPLGEDPEVQAALAQWTADELLVALDPEERIAKELPENTKFLAIPISAALRDFITQKVDEFYASDKFEELWTYAAIQAHDAAVDTLKGNRPAVVADDEKVQINLIPLVDAILAQVVKEVPSLINKDVTLPTVKVEDVPEATREKLSKALGVDLDDDFGTITIYDGGKLTFAQKMVRWIEKLPIATGVLAVLTAGGALLVSPRKRRTGFQLLGGAALAAIAIRRVGFLLQSEVSGLVVKDVNRAAANVVVASFIDPLTGAAATVLWVIALLMLVLAVTGPYGWARSLRGAAASGASSARDAASGAATAPATVTWVVEHREALRIAGWVLAALVLWFASLSWGLLLIVAIGITLWQVGLNRIAGQADADADAEGDGDAIGGGTTPPAGADA